MALYLVHGVFRTPEHDYAHVLRSLSDYAAHQLTEGAWLVESEEPLDLLTTSIFAHLTPADRFIIVEVVAHAGWAASNLEGDSAAWLKRRRP